MATSFPLARTNAIRWRRHGALAFVGLLLIVLRLVPAGVMRALDAMPPVESAATPAPAADNFPGSAYFLAEDAFAPVAAPMEANGVTLLSPDANSPHVLQIEHGASALSMAMQGATSMDAARALLCMTNAIYYEAGAEPEEGQRAVAQVILNRIASGRWPDSVCATVYQGGERADRGCQFTFSCDGSMARIPDAAAWTRARRVAARALGGEVFAPAGLATFYHTLAVRPPWVDSVRPVAVVGAHIFYRLPGEGGASATYRMRYSGREIAQPGPYAFSAPPRPIAVPPGPEAVPAWLPMQPVSAPLAPSLTIPLQHADRIASVASAASVVNSSSSPGLPQSTVRPEYRNSGRVLH